MSTFGRNLDRLDRLCGRGNDTPQWWQDLLSLWRPSGHASGEHGLRLAIRNGYMNFYRLGQSIAQVQIDRLGMPYASTHSKYLARPGETVVGKEYVTLKGDLIMRRGQPAVRYDGIDMLKAWIGTIDGGRANKRNGYVSEEKRLVDNVVAVNPGVIDLEMGLPAWGEQKTAPRMDLVDIELSGDTPTIVFWEAKRISDGRLKDGEKPHVLGQLEKYRVFLGDAQNRRLVVEAYRQTGKLLQQLHELAPESTRAQYPLSGAIKDVQAAPSLDVARHARLVVFNENNRSWAHWEPHEKRLHDEKVLMQVVPDGGPYLLQRIG